MKKLSLQQDPYLPNSRAVSSDFRSLVILTHCLCWAVWELILKMVPDDLCLLYYFLLHLLWLLYHHFDTMEMLIDVFWSQAMKDIQDSVCLNLSWVIACGEPVVGSRRHSSSLVHRQRVLCQHPSASTNLPTAQASSMGNKPTTLTRMIMDPAGTLTAVPWRFQTMSTWVSHFWISDGQKSWGSKYLRVILVTWKIFSYLSLQLLFVCLFVLIGENSPWFQLQQVT